MHVVQRALGTTDAAPWVGRSWTPSSVPTPEPTYTQPPVSRRDTAAPDGLFADTAAPAAVASAPVVEPEREADPVMVPELIQLRRTYLMYEHDDGVILIDQHSAHERVLYERFLREMASGSAPSQRLLFAETIHLDPQDADAFEAEAETFRQIGYEIESFGGHTLLVHAVPTPHPRFDAMRCLRESLAALSGSRSASTHARHEHLAATVACKAAIKAGDPLSRGEMEALFRALTTCTLPAHDVHGRSTIVRLSWDEVERRFGRR
jgi:DNA mismatch repair protein MutL